MIHIHDRMPVVLHAEVLRKLLSEDIILGKADAIIHIASMAENVFNWYKISKAVEDTHNQASKLIESEK